MSDKSYSSSGHKSNGAIGDGAGNMSYGKSYMRGGYTGPQTPKQEAVQAGWRKGTYAGKRSN